MTDAILGAAADALLTTLSVRRAVVHTSGWLAPRHLPAARGVTVPRRRQPISGTPSAASVPAASTPLARMPFKVWK
jgi:hypothetical protein